MDIDKIIDMAVAEAQVTPAPEVIEKTAAPVEDDDPYMAIADSLEKLATDLTEEKASRDSLRDQIHHDQMFEFAKVAVMTDVIAEKYGLNKEAIAPILSKALLGGAKAVGRAGKAIQKVAPKAPIGKAKLHQVGKTMRGAGSAARNPQKAMQAAKDIAGKKAKGAKEFAKKHPVITGAATYGGYKAVTD